VITSMSLMIPAHPTIPIGSLCARMAATPSCPLEVLDHLKRESGNCGTTSLDSRGACHEDLSSRDEQDQGSPADQSRPGALLSEDNGAALTCRRSIPPESTEHPNTSATPFDLVHTVERA